MDLSWSSDQLAMDWRTEGIVENIIYWQEEVGGWKKRIDGKR